MLKFDELQEKWKPVLTANSLPSIESNLRSQVTAVMLENTYNAINEGKEYGGSSFLVETPATNTGEISNYNPVLISLVRRTMPNLIAYDVCGVQPMTGPTGLIFAMRSNYVDPANSALKTEAFYNEANTEFTGANGEAGFTGIDGFPANTDLFGTGTGTSTAVAEALGSTGDDFPEMSMQIDKVTVEAKSRQLKAEYTTETAQDLKAIHGLDAETELSNMLAAELLSEINREVVRTVYRSAVQGAVDDVATSGIFDLDVDSNGRWHVEKFKGLMFQIEREANKIAKQTRRGKGNIIICSSDVAAALQMAGILDYTPALNANNLNPDDTGNTFAGVLNGRYRVYVDPYAGGQYFVVGYKGSNPFDAGVFYCPYVPLQMSTTIGENSFQPKIGFKTRYGMVANPFSQGIVQSGNWGQTNGLENNKNVYYRRVLVKNIL